MTDLAIGVLISAARGALFFSALASAVMFSNQVKPAWSIICATLKGRVRSNQIVALASLGWMMQSVASMVLTGPRIFQTLFFDRSPLPRNAHGADALALLFGYSGHALGFFLPVFAMLWYRGRMRTAIMLFAADLMIACCFGALAAYMVYNPSFFPD